MSPERGAEPGGLAVVRTSPLTMMDGEMAGPHAGGDADKAPGLFGFERRRTGDEARPGDVPDLRWEAPELAPYLLPFQRVVYVRDILPLLRARPVRHAHPSSSRALLELTGVSRLADIGFNGPGNAALPLPEHRDIPEFTILDALVGRDALHMGWCLYGCFPELLRTTLVRLASLQGVTYNPAKEEEPGRIIHWAPDPDSDVAKGITEVNHWEWPYYGSIDSTPMFIRGLLRVIDDDPSFADVSYSGLDHQAHTMSDALAAATAWLDGRLQSSAEGLLEYRMAQERGIWNQAWKDTPEAYVHADGTYANHREGIASIEVQALAYDTLLDLARYYERRLGGPGQSAVSSHLQLQLESARSRAAALKDLVLDRFWLEDERGGYFALATDRDESGKLRPLAVRTSNMGHALHLLDGDDAQLTRMRLALIETLFAGELLDRNGVRTLSEREVRFVPFSYHCGSVWLWDNRVIASELRDAGYHGLACDLERRIWRVVDRLAYFAEFVPGNNAASADELTISKVVDAYDGERDHYSDFYRIEKPAQEIQAWTVEAIRAIKRGNRPLHPELSLPTAAADQAQHSFERRVLGSARFPSA
jgi:hypothetical protein